MSSSNITNSGEPTAYTSLVKKRESVEMQNLPLTEAKKRWGGDGYRFERTISAPDGKVFMKETYRIVMKTDIDEWKNAVNHHMEHGA